MRNVICNGQYLAHTLLNQVTISKLPLNYIYYQPSLQDSEVTMDTVFGEPLLVQRTSLPKEHDLLNTYQLLRAKPTHTVNGIKYINELNSRFMSSPYLTQSREYTMTNLDLAIKMIKQGNRSVSLPLAKLSDNALGKNKTEEFKDTLHLLSLQFVVEDVGDTQILNVIITQQEANIWRCIYTLVICLKLLKDICKETNYEVGKAYHNIGCFFK